jgi:FkbM family methyltransferase
MHKFKNRFLDEIEDEQLSDRQKTYIQAKKLIQIENIDEESVVVDIGSNFGEVIRALTDTGCRIYSFEPHPLFYNILKEEYSDRERVFLFDSAVWTCNQKRNFYFKNSPTSLNGGATLMAEKSNILNLNLNVKVTCLDIAEVVDALEFVDVLKMDVEGAEYELLDRLYETGVYKKVKSIYFEDHSRKMESARFFNLKQKVITNYSESDKELYWW